ncbi:hypothetical protein ACF0H5_013749 [Mactra antiquata]
MDIRVRKLRITDKANTLSRSFPTSGKSNCFNQCLSSSRESLTSEGCRSPKLGQYRKLPMKSECDVCQILTTDATNLKCLHSFCSRCLEQHKIVKNGCPVCERNDLDSNNVELDHVSENNDSPNDEFYFGEQDTELNEETIEELIARLELEVLSGVDEKHSALLKAIDQLNSDAEKEITRIHEYVKHLKSMIDARAETMIRSIIESKERHSAELSRQKKSIEDFITQIHDCIKQHRQTIDWLSFYDANSRKKVERSMKDLIHLSDQISAENVHIRFITKPLCDGTLDIMGKVGVRVFLERPLTCELFSAYRCPSAVHSICPINSNEAWIGYQKYIQLYSKTGTRLCKPIDMGEDVHDIASDTHGKVYIACHSNIKLLNESNNFTTLFHCAKTPQGIAVQKNGNIVTCNGSDVVIYNPEGHVVSTFGGASTSDIKMPYKVYINTNDDICVSDYQSSSGDVVVFDASGKVKAKMRTDGMTPRGVACSKQGIIYAADFRSDRINMYSANGHFLQTAVTSSMCGLSGPLSIAVDPSGDLWVGDWKRTVRVFTQSVVKLDKDSD